MNGALTYWNCRDLIFERVRSATHGVHWVRPTQPCAFGLPSKISVQFISVLAASALPLLRLFSLTADPRSRSAAAGVAGSTALVCMTVIRSVGKGLLASHLLTSSILPCRVALLTCMYGSKYKCRKTVEYAIFSPPYFLYLAG